MRKTIISRIGGCMALLLFGCVYSSLNAFIRCCFVIYQTFLLFYNH